MSKMIWSPSILTNLLKAYKETSEPKKVWEFIKDNANESEVNQFIFHFKSQAMKKGVNPEDLILKRIKAEIASAKQIIPLGEECVNMWVNNIGPARTYAWRKQKKNELIKEKYNV